jgi:uncharacterized protein (DUF924 family)
MPLIHQILTFWFGDPQSEDTRYVERRKLWFSKNPELDQVIRTQFQPVYEQAAAGHLEQWRRSHRGCLALLLLFDQFSRNMFRGTAQMLATDSLALEIAEEAIAKGFDQAVPPIQRIFFYLPFEHSENLEHQRRSVELFHQLCQSSPEFEDVLDYAKRHQAVIERFGRFPHRNLMLDRPTSLAEAEFLQQPGSSF